VTVRVCDVATPAVCSCGHEVGWHFNHCLFPGCPCRDADPTGERAARLAQLAAGAAALDAIRHRPATSRRPAATLDEVVAVIAAHRFGHATEAELQQGLAEVLWHAGYSVEREARLSARDRIDLLVDRVGIEVKVGGSVGNVVRQLERYADSEELDALVLASSRRHHLDMPAALNGKPVVVVSLMAGALR